MYSKFERNGSFPSSLLPLCERDSLCDAPIGPFSCTGSNALSDDRFSTKTRYETEAQGVVSKRG